jgi:hypothetical protein
MKRIVFYFLFLIIAASSIYAQNIKLKNGEQYTNARIISEDSLRIITTNGLNTITILKNQITEIIRVPFDSTKPMLERVPSLPIEEVYTKRNMELGIGYNYYTDRYHSVLGYIIDNKLGLKMGFGGMRKDYTYKITKLTNTKPAKTYMVDTTVTYTYNTYSFGLVYFVDVHIGFGIDVKFNNEGLPTPESFIVNGYYRNNVFLLNFGIYARKTVEGTFGCAFFF